MAVSLVSFGKWTAILTACIGSFLIGHYLLTKEVESGTLAYFFIVFAGIINSVAFLVTLIASLLGKKDRKQLLMTSAAIAIIYLALLTITIYMY